MQNRDTVVRCRVTKAEREMLRRKAAKMKMSVSQYIRFTAIESDNLQVVTIDTTPLQKLGFELTKQGTNLNQLMRFLNTYGVDVYNAKETNRMLAREGQAFLQVMDALSDLKREASKHRVVILANDFINDDEEI